jgi:hypothetical protein
MYNNSHLSTQRWGVCGRASEDLALTALEGTGRMPCACDRPDVGQADEVGLMDQLCARRTAIR